MYFCTRNQTTAKERQREREKKTQKLRNKDKEDKKKGMNVTERGVNMKIKGDKNRELETFPEKESRLLAALFLHLLTLLS